MLIKLFTAFVKVTAFPVQWAVFRTKVYYEDKKIQIRRIKGPAIIISNHTSVWDYGAMLFVFFFRTVRTQMAEVLFKKRLLGLFLRMMGGIKIDRGSFDFGFMTKSRSVLERRGVLQIFPESRLPLKNEQRPLPFKPGAAFLGLTTGAPIIPVYTNGAYFTKKRARMMIGKPVNVRELYDEGLSEKENLEKISAALRDRIIDLEHQLNEKTNKNKKSETVLTKNDIS